MVVTTELMLEVFSESTSSLAVDSARRFDEPTHRGFHAPMAV